MTRVTNFSGSNDSTSSRRGTSQICEIEKRWRSAILKGDVPEISRLLSQSPELANWKDYITGNTALHYAAKVNDISLLRLLAGNYNADVECKNHGVSCMQHLLTTLKESSSQRLLAFLILPDFTQSGISNVSVRFTCCYPWLWLNCRFCFIRWWFLPNIRMLVL
uniref:Ankyrin repeats (Many copies) n=1 Tax=Schistocephalus solidus TaxID=70667 RepID=A0A0X3NQ96_SCHSO